MRQKLITLCPNTFEIAQKMPNFSRWVRQQLLESVESERDLEEKDEITYNSYCKHCDIEYSSPHKFIMEHHYCTKCHLACQYRGKSV